MTNRRLAAAVAAVSLALTGFVATTTVHAAGPQVGVILPDSASSPRWETDDRPLLAAAFKAAGVTYDIQNALGDKTKFATIAQAMLTEGVKVLVLVNLDSPSAAAVEASAKKQGVATIDYDRLTLGGSANYYVSFDNVGVGVLQGDGVVPDGRENVRPVVRQMSCRPQRRRCQVGQQQAGDLHRPPRRCLRALPSQHRRRGRVARRRAHARGATGLQEGRPCKAPPSPLAAAREDVVCEQQPDELAIRQGEAATPLRPIRAGSEAEESGQTDAAHGEGAEKDARPAGEAAAEVAAAGTARPTSTRRRQERQAAGAVRPGGWMRRCPRRRGPPAQRPQLRTHGDTRPTAALQLAWPSGGAQRRRTAAATAVAAGPSRALADYDFF